LLGEPALFVAEGFAAQLTDGAIGMAYGVFATGVLLGLGIPPATASASVHVAEVFTTGASGLAHWRMDNVRRDLVLRLAVLAGGVLDVYLLSAAPTGAMRVGVGIYLMALGALILLKALRPRPPAELPPRQAGILGSRGRRRVALARHPGAGPGRGAGGADRGAPAAAAARPAADGGRGRGGVAAGAPQPARGAAGRQRLNRGRRDRAPRVAPA
jgi:uncharacterized membrane protein YfcA